MRGSDSPVPPAPPSSQAAQPLIAYRTLVGQAFTDVMMNGANFINRVGAADDIEWVVEKIIDARGGTNDKQVRLLVKFKGWKPKCAHPMPIPCIFPFFLPRASTREI